MTGSGSGSNVNDRNESYLTSKRICCIVFSLISG